MNCKKILDMNCKKILALLLAVLLLLTASLTLCKRDVDDVDDVEEPSDTVADTPDTTNNGEILISDKGEIKFKIVLAENLPVETEKTITELGKIISKYSGTTFKAFETADVRNYNAETYEILIGNTGYPESLSVMDQIAYGEWSAQFVGNKLVCTGFCGEAIVNSVAEVTAQIKKGATDDGTISMKADFNVKKSYFALANVTPKFDEQFYPSTIVHGGQDTAISIFRGVSAERYAHYADAIVNKGFRVYSLNEIGDNKFYTYENGTHSVHAAYNAYEKILRVSVEEGVNIVTCKENNTWTAVDGITSSLAQLGLGEPDGGGGMGYCIQLADGSFILVDGGYSDDAKVFYDYMKAKAPNGEIVIAAWIITHTDGDHVDAFYRFAADYVDEVKLEQFIINIPQGGNDKAITLAKSIPDCKVIKVHTGQKFYIRNAEIEMLYTADDRVPEYTLESGQNTLSLVFSVEIAGEKIMFTGDMDNAAAALIYRTYGTYLKSDILQLAHHGLRNGTGLAMSNVEAFYTFVCPEIVLLPSSYQQWTNKDNKEELQMSSFSWNLVALECARECYIASADITVLELPYRIFSAYKFYEDSTYEPVCKDAPSSSESMSSSAKIDEENILQTDWNSGRNV